jgi:hypothetical protein
VWAIASISLRARRAERAAELIAVEDPTLACERLQARS